jgi:hypothetical protein
MASKTESSPRDAKMAAAHRNKNQNSLMLNFIKLTLFRKVFVLNFIISV